MLSLNTDDLATTYDEARKKVSKNLLRLNCLSALKSRLAKIKIPIELKFALGRLNQTEELHRVERDCNAQLDTLKFQAAGDKTALTLASDLLNVHERMAKTDFEMRLKISALNDQKNSQALRELTGMSTLKTNLRHSLEAAKANAALESLIRDQKQDELNRVNLIEAELDRISDALMKSENDLSRIENIREKRFVYASTSGRVQRLRVSGEGGRIAAGAYIMEIAPLTTDFEVLATVGIADSSDVVIGQDVQVQLSGGMPKPIWVPAQIEDVNKVTSNKRLVRIKLRREDLNKRDLLLGDHSLNGLGEQSEAIVSLSSESAMHSIKAIMLRHLRFGNGTSL
ncbi:HlyD family efflux transporter periplasmic adaptor subunit [Amylibacter ulvae]|uniref:HlyD family efflux transporter periplasmic adaptor subunit n=1 Tax=Paramylibacter ulvae TaxID=1651968 RepID=UPI001E29E733